MGFLPSTFHCRFSRLLLYFKVHMNHARIIDSDSGLEWGLDSVYIMSSQKTQVLVVQTDHTEY